MSGGARAAGGFAMIAAALLAVGFGQSWAVSLAILNLCLISAVMALGVNIQWGYAGLFNVGTMAFAALGGLAAVLVSESPVPAALSSQSWRHSRCVQAKRRWLTGMRNWGDCLMKSRRRVSDPLGTP